MRPRSVDLFRPLSNASQVYRCRMREVLILMWIGGSIGALVLFARTQFRFYKAHRARYGTWRGRYDFFLEPAAMSKRTHGGAFQAHFRRADDPAVERLRRLTLITWVLPFIWFVCFPFVGSFLIHAMSP